MTIDRLQSLVEVQSALNFYFSGERVDISTGSYAHPKTIGMIVNGDLREKTGVFAMVGASNHSGEIVRVYLQGANERTHATMVPGKEYVDSLKDLPGVLKERSIETLPAGYTIEDIL